MVVATVLICAVAMCAAGPLSGDTGGAQPARQPGDDADLLEFLTLQLESARARVASVVYEYEFESIRYVSTRGVIAASGAGAVSQAGERRASVHRRTTTHDGQAGREVIVRCVLTEHHFAVRPYQHNIPSWYDRTTTDVRDEPFEMARRMAWGVDILSFGFGNGEQTLRAAMDNPDRSMRWEVEQTTSADGRRGYRVMQFTPHVTVPGIPTTEFYIDQLRGGLITSVIARTPDGSVGIERSVRVEQIGPDRVWFPVEVEETVHEAWLLKGGRPGTLVGKVHLTEDGHRVVKTKTYRVTSVEVNSPIQDEEFTIRRALNLSEGSTILHVRPDGTREPHVLVRGELTPRDDSPQQASQRLGEPSESGPPPQDALDRAPHDLQEFLRAPAPMGQSIEGGDGRNPTWDQPLAGVMGGASDGGGVKGGLMLGVGATMIVMGIWSLRQAGRGRIPFSKG